MEDETSLEPLPAETLSVKAGSWRLWLIPGVVVALVGAAALAWSQWGAGWLMPRVAAQIEAATGLRWAADGPVRAQLVPWGLRAARVQLVSGEAAAGRALVTADAAAIDLSWSALLRGRIGIAQVHLAGAHLVQAPVHQPVDIVIATGPSELSAVLSDEESTLDIAAHRDGTTLALDHLALRTRGRGLVAEGTGRLTFGDPIRLAVNAAGKASDAPLGAVALAVSYSDDGLVVDRATWRRPDGLDVSLFGHLAPSGGDAVRFEGGLGASSRTDTAFDASAEFDGTFGAHGLDMTLGNIDVRSGGSRLTGEATLRPGAPARLAASLKLDRLDLDTLRHSSLGQLASALAGVDIDAETALHLLVDGIAAGGKTMAEGVVVDAVQHGGAFDLHELSVRSLAGAPLHVSGRVALGPAPVAAFDPVNVVYGRTTASGRLRIDVSGGRPRVDGDLAMGPLRLDALIPRPPPLPPEPLTRRARAAARAMPPAATPAWPQKPFDLPAAFPIDADLALAAPRVAWHGQEIDNVRARLALRAHRLSITGLEAAAYGGQLMASGGLERSDRPHLAAEIQLVGADLGRMLADFGVGDVAARGNVSAELAADGDNAAALVSTLAGTVTLADATGAISGVDLAALSDRLKQRPNRPTDIFHLARFAAGGRTPFSDGRGHVRIDQGIARTDDLRLTAAAGDARVHGSVDLPRRTLHLVNEFGLTDPPGVPPLVVNLDGPLAAPRRIFDITRLQAYLLHRGDAEGRR